ncbi:RdRP-domain-containing protein [Vararia minispora EC-137]|uniref:RdRP-domain-containing protein n=1 Tax=Vararia minispora EC-137 TaxID=1314806 RepID=A0ACB8QC21_9AGAM|nr:RdRP-domain-containing protein [Vararia minispora EC-137]
MEFTIRGVDHDATKFEVQRIIQNVLHGPDVYDPQDPHYKGRLPNFMVKLNPSHVGREHDGSGTLVVPRRLGDRFREWLASPMNRILVRGHKVRFIKSPRKVSQEERQVLENALYIGPDQEEKRHRILQYTQYRLRVAKMQFGAWYRPPAIGQMLQDRVFSVEYERDCTRESAGYIEVVYDHKLIKIELGNRFTEEQCQYVVVKLTSIKKIGVGVESFGNPYIIFDMYVPPTFEEKSFNDRPREGFKRKMFKDRDRVSALDDAHACVAPYSPHLRVVLFDMADCKAFYDLCCIAQLEPRPVRKDRIEANKCMYFSSKQLWSAERWMRTLSWNDAFQIEALLRNGTLNTQDVLFDLRPHIGQVIKRFGPLSSDILRLYNVALGLRHPDESPVQCLLRVADDNAAIESVVVPPGQFLCHHITFTPTRVLLEGPYVTQSNRIIRRYQKDYAPHLLENFVRVDFREEDRLSYRWDREVDGTYFLHQRVGKILKEGFNLGGKSFEFLAYSNSALRSHAVWFMSPFQDPDEGYVNAERIRSSIGDFSDLRTTPSKLAARIAQAFTATDPSVNLVIGQWEEMPDIETELPSGRISCHTDGVGTISPELGDMIWDVMCAASRGYRSNRVRPSAYQIRFLGYKGVVAIDHRLKGVLMRLRPSQRKFHSHEVGEAPLEIARAFDYPNAAYLNKPIVMVLEDRGVDKNAFIELQELAKMQVYTAQDSLPNFRNFLRASNLGLKFHLPFILEQLYLLGLDLTDRDGKRVLGNNLMGRLLRYGINNVLRDIKHRARIPVPKSYQLVGVADEGTTYVKEGHSKNGDIFTLKPGNIYACIQNSADEEPVFLKGNCVISRSPVVHPGDVQRVFAIGEPPKDKECFFRGLKNCVVLPTEGERSLASCLGGGDLDGDVFDIYIGNPELLPVMVEQAATYDSVTPYQLPDGRTATIEDICDFVVEYINSDVLALDHCRSIQGSVISRAVDYAKHGNPIDLDSEKLPRFLIPYKPDWHKAEVTNPHDNDYYVSTRALGHLYRGIQLEDVKTPVDIPVSEPGPPLTDSISFVLLPIVQDVFAATLEGEPVESDSDLASMAANHFARYARELRYIRATHTLTDTPTAKLDEEEVILGVILSTCTQKRWREDRVFKMKLHTEALVRDIRARLTGLPDDEDIPGLRAAVRRSWVAWIWCQENTEKEGSVSFGLLVLGSLLDALKRLNVLPEPLPTLPADAEEEEWW